MKPAHTVKAGRLVFFTRNIACVFAGIEDCEVWFVGDTNETPQPVPYANLTSATASDLGVYDEWYAWDQQQMQDRLDKAREASKLGVPPLKPADRT